MQVSLPAHDLYRRWRQQIQPGTVIRETAGAEPPERLLQSVWHHQRLLRDRLVTLDGRTLRILHPGFLNREAGPDFRGAVVQFNDDAPVTGDVEVDLRAAGWKHHGHDRNPGFRRVILHVIWSHQGESLLEAPTLVLRPVLDASVEELEEWFRAELPGDWPATLRGRCCAPLRNLSVEMLDRLLRQAAQVRLERKAAEIKLRARQAGWENAFWEAMLRALGYKQNPWPMLRLGELLPALRKIQPRSALEWQAILLGTAGLLPTEAVSRSTPNRKYVMELWSIWWRHRAELSVSLLPRSIWRFNGVRPSNHPARRLALAAHWLALGGTLEKVEKWFQSESAPSAISLGEALDTPEDPFWNYHWTLRSAKFRKPAPLLGSARMTDLALNVILPWFWTRAQLGRNKSMQQRAERCYFSWPSGQDNSLLRTARQRLLGGNVRLPGGAAAQQGLLQIIRDFCDHSNSLCEECRFPALVQQLDLPGGA